MYMGVFINKGTPKSTILIGFSLINHPAIGFPAFLDGIFWHKSESQPTRQVTPTMRQGFASRFRLAKDPGDPFGPWDPFGHLPPGLCNAISVRSDFSGIGRFVVGGNPLIVGIPVCEHGPLSSLSKTSER